MRRLHALMFLAVPLVSTMFARRAQAEQVQVDICKEVIEDVFIPATFTEQLTCREPSPGLCMLMGHCCVPGLCLTDPVCVVANQVIKAAEHWEQRTTIKCDPEWQDPEAEFRKWLAGQIPMLDTVLIPGAFTAFKADVAAMRTQGVKVPAGAKTIIKNAMASYWSANTAKFAQVDLDNSTIISNTHSLAKPYLKPGYGGITLGDVIVLDDAVFKIITGENWASANLKTSWPRAWAMQILVHEHVHVRQYRELGLEAFFKQYFVEVMLAGGYSHDMPLEAEAYAFSDLVHKSQGWAMPTAPAAGTSSSSSALSVDQTTFFMRNCVAAAGGNPITAAQQCWSKVKAASKMASLEPQTPVPFVQSKRGAKKILTTQKVKIQPAKLKELATLPIPKALKTTPSAVVPKKAPASAQR